MRNQTTTRLRIISDSSSLQLLRDEPTTHIFLGVAHGANALRFAIGIADQVNTQMGTPQFMRLALNSYFLGATTIRNLKEWREGLSPSDRSCPGLDAAFVALDALPADSPVFRGNRALRPRPASHIDSRVLRDSLYRVIRSHEVPVEYTGNNPMNRNYAIANIALLAALDPTARSPQEAWRTGEQLSRQIVDIMVATLNGCDKFVVEWISAHSGNR